MPARRDYYSRGAEALLSTQGAFLLFRGWVAADDAADHGLHPPHTRHH